MNCLLRRFGRRDRTPRLHPLQAAKHLRGTPAPVLHERKIRKGLLQALYDLDKIQMWTYDLLPLEIVALVKIARLPVCQIEHGCQQGRQRDAAPDSLPLFSCSRFNARRTHDNPGKTPIVCTKQRQELPTLATPIRRSLKLSSGQTDDYNFRRYKPPTIPRNRPLVFCVAVFSKNFKRIIPAFSFCVLRCFQNRLQQ